MKDAVEQFMQFVNRPKEDDFVQWALDLIVLPEPEVVYADYAKLVDEIHHSNAPVFIRAYGRGNNAENRLNYSSFIRELIGKDCTFDATNNSNPTKRFFSSSGIRKGEYVNYKLSHIWSGMSKNPFAFCALWNMCLTPFFIDPFTGHETKGTVTDKLQHALWEKVVALYSDSIGMYNEEAEKVKDRVQLYLDDQSKFGRLSAKNRIDIALNFRTIGSSLR